MSDVEVKGFASNIDELAKRLNGTIVATIEGEQWSYALIENERALVITKYSPRSKTLFMRGLIAIPHEDVNKVVRALDNVSKEIVKKVIKRLAEKYGLELNVK